MHISFLSGSLKRLDHLGDLVIDGRKNLQQRYFTTSPSDSWTYTSLQLNSCCHSSYVISSLTRGCLSFIIASGPLQRSHSQVRVPRGHDHILLSQTPDSPNLEGQVLVFISHRNRVAQLYPQALGSLSVASSARRATVEVIDPASTREYFRRHGTFIKYSFFLLLLCIDGTFIKHGFFLLLLCIGCRWNVFFETLHSKVHLLWLHYLSFLRGHTDTHTTRLSHNLNFTFFQNNESWLRADLRVLRCEDLG
jgi:hypothetical protein